MPTWKEAAAHALPDVEYAFLEYSPPGQQEAGSSVDSDGSCCSCPIGRGLRLLEYRRREVRTNWMEAAT